MTLVLDTSILIAIERKEKVVMDKLKEISKGHILFPKISFMSYFEFVIGLKIKKPKKMEELFVFVNNFNCLQTTRETAGILADLKIRYDGEGVSLSLTDLLIASQVIENKMVLVTRDRDFLKIGELKSIIV